MLRAYHQTASNFLRTLVPATFRDLQALIYVLLLERSSLPAYTWLWRHRHEIRRRRHYIQGRKTAPDEHLERWFRHHALPLDNISPPKTPSKSISPKNIPPKAP